MRICRKAFITLLMTVAALSALNFASVSAASSETDGAMAASVYFDAAAGGSEQQDLIELRDGKTYTSVTFASDTHIDFQAQEPVSRIYIMLDKPGKWSVTLPDGRVLESCEYGFIHELADFGTKTDRFEMDISAGSRVAEIFAFTDGKLPDWVQIWEPPCENADLLVLPTHADDEFLWFGGVLPYYAGELGYEVQVVYLTNHYNMAIREHERLNGLWAVGVRHYPIVGEQFTDLDKTKKYDAAAETFGYQNVLAFQVEMLRRFHPRVVVAHDIKGEYGHGAHILNARTLLEALEMTGDPDAFPQSAKEYGVCKVQKCYLHLWEENRITVKWNRLKLEKFGGRSALEMARLGFEKHQTQTAFYEVKDIGLCDCRIFGLAYTNVGYDTPDTNDMFEHVDWSKPVREVPPSDTGKADVSGTDAVSPADLSQGTQKKSALLPVLLIAAALVIGTAAAVLVPVLKKQKKLKA